MNRIDQLKVINAGFTIIRERGVGLNNRSPIISAKTREQPEWHNYYVGFPSKAARHRAMKELLKDQRIIED